MTLIRVKDLRGLREQRGLSLKEAAEKLKTSENTLSSIERETYTTSTRHEIVKNYIRFLLTRSEKQGEEIKPSKKQPATPRIKTAERKEPTKNKSRIEQVSVEEGRKLGQWRLKVGVTKRYAAQLIGKSTVSITNKERGSYLFTREEYDTLKAVYEAEAEEKYQGGLNNE